MTAKMAATIIAMAKQTMTVRRILDPPHSGTSELAIAGRPTIRRRRERPTPGPILPRRRRSLPIERGELWNSLRRLPEHFCSRVGNPGTPCRQRQIGRPLPVRLARSSARVGLPKALGDAVQVGEGALVLWMRADR